VSTQTIIIQIEAQVPENGKDESCRDCKFFKRPYFTGDSEFCNLFQEELTWKEDMYNVKKCKACLKACEGGANENKNTA